MRKRKTPSFREAGGREPYFVSSFICIPGCHGSRGLLHYILVDEPAIAIDEAELDTCIGGTDPQCPAILVVPDLAVFIDFAEMGDPESARSVDEIRYAIDGEALVDVIITGQEGLRLCAGAT